MICKCLPIKKILPHEFSNFITLNNKSVLKFNIVLKIIMKKYILLFIIILMTKSCGVYNFTGTTGKISAKTFQVNFFRNNASIVQPGIDRTFTQRLQNLIQNQTNLSLTSAMGDLVYEGEITDYAVSPMAATANQGTAQNRLTITVNVRFLNKKNDKENFEKSFNFFYDFAGNSQLSNSVLNKAIDEIFERITQDVFNESLAKW